MCVWAVSPVLSVTSEPEDRRETPGSSCGQNRNRKHVESEKDNPQTGRASSQPRARATGDIPGVLKTLQSQCFSPGGAPPLQSPSRDPGRRDPCAVSPRCIFKRVRHGTGWNIRDWKRQCPRRGDGTHRSWSRWASERWAAANVGVGSPRADGDPRRLLTWATCGLCTQDPVCQTTYT